MLFILYLLDIGMYFWLKWVSISSLIFRFLLILVVIFERIKVLKVLCVNSLSVEIKFCILNIWIVCYDFS